MFRMKGKKIIMVASVLALALGSVSASAMSGDGNSANKSFTTLADRDTKATYSASSSSKVMLDKNGNAVDKDGKIVMTAEKLKSMEGVTVESGVASCQAEVTKDKDGNVVDKDGKIIMTAEKLKSMEGVTVESGVAVARLK